MKTVFSLVVSLAVVRGCLGKCYYPDGTLSTEDEPCDPDAEVSMCCSAQKGFASSCLANKLCGSTTNRIIRGSCTDPTWMSPECPNFCVNWGNRGWDLISCSNSTHTDTSYCCDTMSNCCDGGIGRFDLLPPQPYTYALFDTAKLRYVVQTPLPTTSSTTSAPSSATSTASNASLQQTPATSATSATQASTTSGGGQPAAQTGQSGSQPLAEWSPGLSTAAQAGIGVGAAVGALLVAAVAYLWWRLHKTRQQQQQARGDADMSTTQWQNPQGAYPSQPTAAHYYAHDPQRKFELHSAGETHELQGHHYFVQGDESNAELTTQPPYTPESPVVTRGVAR